MYGRLLSEVTEKTHTVEIRLALGCNKHEAVLPVLRAAMKAALVTIIPSSYMYSYFDRLDDPMLTSFLLYIRLVDAQP